MKILLIVDLTFVIGLLTVPLRFQGAPLLKLKRPVMMKFLLELVVIPSRLLIQFVRRRFLMVRLSPVLRCQKVRTIRPPRVVTRRSVVKLLRKRLVKPTSRREKLFLFVLNVFARRRVIIVRRRTIQPTHRRSEKLPMVRNLGRPLANIWRPFKSLRRRWGKAVDSFSQLSHPTVLVAMVLLRVVMIRLHSLPVRPGSALT